jgi:capsular polysaccharide biosynthesis protein
MPRRLLIIGTLLLVALVSAVVPNRPGEARAEASIVATGLDVSVNVLPGYAQTVFHSEQVARAVADRRGTVTLTTHRDGILLTVVGHSEDQETAVDIANNAARVYITALNTAGAAVGTFAILSAAQPVAQPGGLTLATATAIAVVLLVIGVAGALAAAVLLRHRMVRRPPATV